MNRKIIWLFSLILLIFVITNSSDAQRYSFGNIILKDTNSGDAKFTTGSIYTDNDIHVHASTGNYYFGGETYGFGFNALEGEILCKAQSLYLESPVGAYTILEADTVNGLRVYDNLTVDSLFITKNTALITINADDKEVTVNSSFMWIDSDNGISTDRTFTLTNGTTSGQQLKLLFFDTGGSGNQCELITTGNVLLDENRTATFDNDREMLNLIWDGNYWVELTRDL